MACFLTLPRLFDINVQNKCIFESGREMKEIEEEFMLLVQEESEVGKKILKATATRWECSCRCVMV